MIPIFTSHYSIGKSILTLNQPNLENTDGSDSVFDIVKENNIKQLVLVENETLLLILSNHFLDKKFS